MGRAESGITALAPGKASIEILETQQSPSGLHLQMVESAGPPGHVPAPPLSQIVLSVAIGYSFRYRCDLGAGMFSGQGAPMDFVLVVPNAHTWCEIHDWHRLRFLGIPIDFARDFLRREGDEPLDFGALHARQNRDPFVAWTLDTIWQELGRGDELCELFLESAVGSLLARLKRLSGQISSQSMTRGGLAGWQSARVLDYMRENLDGCRSLSELAEVAGLSPWHFARAFRDSHGMPPHRYLTRLRLEKARELLANSSLSITEIAAATGYSSQHLARRFRCYQGCTPSAYRRQLRS